MRRLSVILAISIFTFIAPAYGSDINVTIYVDADYRPFSFSEQGQAKGIYIDVLRTAFSRMNGFKVNMKPVPWKRGKLIMETGEGFGLAPAFFHGHDWPYLYPYSLPFYTETIIAVCQENALTSPRKNWPHDYLGLKIGNVAGFDGWGGDLFKTFIGQGKIRYEEARGSKQNIQKLALGRLDCIMMEDKAFDIIHNQLNTSGEFKPGQNLRLYKSATIGQDPVYIGYSKPAIEAGKYPFHIEFRQAFDTVIYTMGKNGEILAIMNAYKE